MFRNVPECSMFRILSTACAASNILTTKKDQITRGDKESLTRRMQSLLLENLVLGKKSNQQTKTMRTKTNYKPKANDKGKENTKRCRSTAFLESAM